jgi:hypothetical protein
MMVDPKHDNQSNQLETIGGPPFVVPNFGIARDIICQMQAFFKRREVEMN